MSISLLPFFDAALLCASNKPSVRTQLNFLLPRSLPRISRIATLIYPNQQSLESDEKVKKEFYDVENRSASSSPPSGLCSLEIAKINRNYQERLRKRRLQKIDPPETAGKDLFNVNHYSDVHHYITQSCRAQSSSDEQAEFAATQFVLNQVNSGQLTALLESIIGYEVGETSAELYNKRWTLIQKYFDCFKQFKVDPEGAVCLLKGEKTSLKFATFFKGILKVMRTHLTQPNLTRNCEFGEKVEQRAFDVKYKEGKLSIISADKLLGSGGFGIVYKALELTAGKVVAQKIPNFNFKSQSQYNEIRNFLYDEYQSFQQLPKREGYVGGESFLETQNGLSLILPFVPNGDLFSLLEKDVSPSQRFELLKSVWTVTKGLIQTDQTRHPDIKAENYMLLDFPKVALIDWVKARHRNFFNSENPERFVMAQVHSGTPQYYFAELLQNISIVLKEQNVELLGRFLDERMLYMTATTMFMVLCSSYPRGFDENNFQDMSQEIDMSYLKNYQEPIIKFITDLLHSDKRKRLNSWEQADKSFVEMVTALGAAKEVKEETKEESKSSS